MNKLEVKIIKRIALVRLTKSMYKLRRQGLIQFLSPFCEDIQWSIEEDTNSVKGEKDG